MQFKLHPASEVCKGHVQFRIGQAVPMLDVNWIIYDAEMKTYFIPRQALLPFVNAVRYRSSRSPVAVLPFVRIHRSGSNFSGLGKMVALRWIRKGDEPIGV